MAKVIVYDVYTQALETFYLEENDPMPYVYDRTMLVREFRGSSRSSVLWTTNAAMEAWNATRRAYGAPIPFRYAFKRIWEGGHGKQSQHYAGVSFDVGQVLTQAERNRIWNTANNLGVWVYVEPIYMTPTWVGVWLGKRVVHSPHIAAFAPQNFIKTVFHDFFGIGACPVRENKGMQTYPYISIYTGTYPSRKSALYDAFYRAFFTCT